MFHSRVHLVFIWPRFWKLRFFLCKNATCRCCFSMFLEGYFIPIFFYVSSFFCFCPMKIFSLQISKYMYMRFRICKTTPANNKNRMMIWQQLIRMLYSFKNSPKIYQGMMRYSLCIFVLNYINWNCLSIGKILESSNQIVCIAP